MSKYHELLGFIAVRQHRHDGYDVEEAINNTETGVKSQGLSREALDALKRHGYEPLAAASGVSHSEPQVWEGMRVILRSRVCELDGITIDGHEVSDLDPADDYCMYCHKEGWMTEQMRQEDEL